VTTIQYWHIKLLCANKYFARDIVQLFQNTKRTDNLDVIQWLENRESERKASLILQQAE